MQMLCHSYFSLFFILVKLLISETISDFDATKVIIDIDDEYADVISYKRNKLARPFALQNKTERIVGGNKTTIEEYPFIVSLQQIGDFHICGGAIVNPTWIVTASHCITECELDPCIKEVVKDPGDYQIVAGTSDAKPMEWGQIREIEKFVKHPKFGRPLLHNDIALIKVKNPFEFCKTVQPIEVPNESELRGKDVSSRYKDCIALGWGAQKPRSGKKAEDLSEQEKKDIENDLVAPILMVVSLPVIPIKLCKRLINDKYITNRHLCTMYAPGGRDACEGDSGGPLVCNKILYGVTSWGHGCARRNTPAVFTRVDTYNGWIENVFDGRPNVDYYSSANNAMFASWMLYLKILQFSLLNIPLIL